ncbi:amphiphysin isoform X2 [Cololabis saira]|uniref:amphiphysin isoform X2 n=1 Tax=Cololabis saira TaxID=129043 RepID=UPI002AD5750C|nr:amphiphysin isoform X2 [Cololabis saira]
MAEIRTGVFAKNVQKRLNRAQEKVLQKLGKADETKDEQFEQAVSNFRRQECEGSRLQREMKNYMSAIKGMQQASINLTQSLHEVYEPDWHGKDDVLSIGKDCDALWEDFHNKLVDSTLLNLDEYLQQFPDLKTRVAKRSRKLIDYDSARHHLETLQASGMKNDRKMMKAEDELKKAQNVFDELNVGLQDELPYLWDCRVEFYISTFKSVTNLETKFHREISLVCRHLYEVMTKLAEQHSDKVFTIQGAPSDSGPLRLARTPSPPEDESPPESPEASSNQMLRPVSPGPPRPKSPMQFKKGPPVPPPPKATPTKEVAEEQIIDLFGGEFLPAPSPSQLNERPGESLLDLDFDAFQPDESVSPIPQTAVPWDIWSASTQAAQPVADPGFDVDWSADFGAVSADGDADLTAQAPAAPEPSPVVPQGEQEGNQGGGQGWPRDQGLQPGGGTSTCTQDSEPTAAGDEVSSWESPPNSILHPYVIGTEQEDPGQGDVGDDRTEQKDRRKSTPGLIFTNEYGEEIEDSTGDRIDKWSRSLDGSGSEYETAEEWGDGGAGGGWASADDEPSYEDCHPVSTSEEQGVGAASDCQTISLECDTAHINNSGKETDPTSVCKDHLETGGQEVKRDLSSTTEAADILGFDSDPIIETQEGDVLDKDLFAESPGGGAFDTDPFAESQGGGEFDKDPFAESPGGGAFDKDPFAESPGEGAFDTDPFAESPGGGAFDTDPFAESQGGGAFDKDPFAESPGGGAFDTDPFAESQGQGVFDTGHVAESQGICALDKDPFAESPGGSVLDLDPNRETQAGIAFDSDAFADTNLENKSWGFEVDPFADTSGQSRVSTEAKSGWDTDPFPNSYPPASTGTEVPASTTSSWEHVSQSGFDSSVTQHHFICGTAEVKNEFHIPLTPKEPENSDMSEDEAANRRFGKLYQELDTEKEEDGAAPSFFAEFDKMNEVKRDSAEAPGGSETQTDCPTEAAEDQDKRSEPLTGAEEHESSPASAVDQSVSLSSVGGIEEETPAPAAEVEDCEASRADEDEPQKDLESLKEDDPTAIVGSPYSEKLELGEEKMAIPSVVIEPASSNEGDDDHDGDIISPTTISDNGVTPESQTMKHISPSGGESGLPTDFVCKVETMHDFEAANSDELELKRGDVVLVVPTASLEDQEAGWLTGIKESEWLTLGVSAHRGLFPENFTQRLE